MTLFDLSLTSTIAGVNNAPLNQEEISEMNVYTLKCSFFVKDMTYTYTFNQYRQSSFFTKI